MVDNAFRGETPHFQSARAARRHHSARFCLTFDRMRPTVRLAAKERNFIDKLVQLICNFVAWDDAGGLVEKLCP
jgi:hypothetical protein